MAQLVQLGKSAEDIAKLFKVNAERMTRAAPKGFDPQRLLSVAFNAICYNTDLLACSRESLIGGAFEALKLGLTLGGPMQEAWLIPFNNRKKVGSEWATVKEAVFIVGYQGYRNLIDRARAVVDMHPRAVHNGMVPEIKWTKKYDKDVPQVVGFTPGTPDEFDFEFGTSERIVHRPKNAMPEYKEQLRAVYLIANLRGGGRQTEVMELEEIERHRNRSRAKDNGPWVVDYVPMALKTAVRKAAKYLPKASIELARALSLDNAADAGAPQNFDVEGIIIPPETLAQGTNAPRSNLIEGLKEALRVSEPAQEKAPVPAQPPADSDIPWGN